MVLLFTLEYPPDIGGVANYYGNLVKYWTPFANSASVVPQYCGTKGAATEDKSNINVLAGKKLIKPHWLFAAWKLWRAIKKNKIRTVLVGQILPLGTVAWLLAKFIKFDYVVFLHGMDLAYALKVARKKKLARKILAGAKKIIAANSYAAKLVSEIVSENKIVVVNPGIGCRITHNAQPAYRQGRRITQIKEKYNLQNKLVLLQVGRLVKRKGVDKVLEALPQVWKEISEVVYVIIGDGPELASIKHQASSIKRNTILITDATDEEVQSWYEFCDIFIMPAREIDGDFEGFGIVYLEANARGKPVIAGDSGGVRDAVVDGVNGLLVNPESADEIAQAIIKLAKDENLRKKLGEQGRKWARKFDWQEQVEKVRKFIKL